MKTGAHPGFKFLGEGTLATPAPLRSQWCWLTCQSESPPLMKSIIVAGGLGPRPGASISIKIKKTWKKCLWKGKKSVWNLEYGSPWLHPCSQIPLIAEEVSETPYLLQPIFFAFTRVHKFFFAFTRVHKFFFRVHMRSQVFFSRSHAFTVPGCLDEWLS